MSFTPIPLTVVVRAKVEGRKVIFPEAVTIPVTHLNIEELYASPGGCADPAAKGATGLNARTASDVELAFEVKEVLRHDIAEAEREAGFGKLASAPWTILDAGPIEDDPLPAKHYKIHGKRAERRMLLLRFDPSKLSLPSGPKNRELPRHHQALIEQATIQINVEVTDPRQSESVALVPLIVKLLIYGGP